MKSQLMLVGLLLLLLVTLKAAPAEDEVKELKGFYDFSSEFKMYSGYLALQEQPQISTHYIFTTSKNNPQTDDLILWLNGGPGCSSLIGFLQEIGPHVVLQGSLGVARSKNPYSWNSNANIIYFESPPGVGFSINKDPAYNYTDPRTTQDNLNALRQWFKKFPEFSKNKFWIAGESYAGMYIPFLSDQIIKNKDSIIPGSTIDFRGILIGNGVLIMEDDWRLRWAAKFLSDHYFFGPEIDKLLSTCKYDDSDDSNPSCAMGQLLAYKAIERINNYYTTGICYDQFSLDGMLAKSRNFFDSFSKRIGKYLKNNELNCESDNNGLNAVLNDNVLKAQLHVDTSITWASCNYEVNLKYNRDDRTIDLFDSFKKYGLKILLFSGNVDVVVSYMETEEYLRLLNWRLVEQKRPVVNSRGSLNGWITEYEGLSYFIINGAGHMVPADKPHAAYEMFNWFLKKVK